MDQAQWDASTIRGVGARRKSLGTEVDALGNTVNVYEVDDSEWGPVTAAKEQHAFAYIEWHQKYHVKQKVRDPRCSICTAEQQFENARAPHEQNHRLRGQFDPNCRFCQDDKFLGRM